MEGMVPTRESVDGAEEGKECLRRTAVKNWCSEG